MPAFARSGAENSFFAHLLRTGVSTLWGPLPAISCHKMT